MWDTAEGLPLLLQDGGTRYVLGPDGTPVESIGVTGTVLYYLHDQLGSTRGLFAASGQNVASYTYTPFGAVSLHTGSVTTPLQYAGQYTDAETGWQYLQARYYDPATSQFVSVDPLASQTGQPYAYAADDPLNGVDPWGLASGSCNGASGQGMGRLLSAVGDTLCNSGQLTSTVLTGRSNGTTNSLAATWNTQIRPTLYADTVAEAGFLDRYSLRGFSRLADQFGAHVDPCSPDYLRGYGSPGIATGAGTIRYYGPGQSGFIDPTDPNDLG